MLFGLQCGRTDLDLLLGTLRCHDGDDNEKRQKSNRLNGQNNNSARASSFFVHFFAVTSRKTGKCLISPFMEDVKKRRLNFLSLSELVYGS